MLILLKYSVWTQVHSLKPGNSNVILWGLASPAASQVYPSVLSAKNLNFPVVIMTPVFTSGRLHPASMHELIKLELMFFVNEYFARRKIFLSSHSHQIILSVNMWTFYVKILTSVSVQVSLFPSFPSKGFSGFFTAQGGAHMTDNEQSFSWALIKRLFNYMRRKWISVSVMKRSFDTERKAHSDETQLWHWKKGPSWMSPTATPSQ